MIASVLLALAPISTWTLEGWIVAIVILAAVVSVAVILLRFFGVVIPPIFWQIFWICVAAAFGILAIRFLFSL